MVRDPRDRVGASASMGGESRAGRDRVHHA